MMDNMDDNIKAVNAFMEALQDAGLPVASVFPDGYVRWINNVILDARQQADADVIIDDYKAGRFDYLDNRVYPEYGEQLDMLFRAIAASPEMQIIFAEFYDTIRAIKDAYPKPTELEP